jgi:hypothetical protein
MNTYPPHLPLIVAQPKGYKPELIPFWPTGKAIFIPAAQVPPGLWLKGKPEVAAPAAPAKSPE